MSTVKAQVIEYVTAHPTASTKEVAEALSIANVKTVGFYMSEMRTANGTARTPRVPSAKTTPAALLRAQLEALKARGDESKVLATERAAIAKALPALKDFPLSAQALNTRDAVCEAALLRAASLAGEIAKLEAAILIFEPAAAPPAPVPAPAAAKKGHKSV